ncbi:hypothetical protein PMAYCL1PPCAC_20111, partial [Pristionchus mayeri]
FKAENRKKRRCVRRASKNRKVDEKTVPVPPIDDEKKEDDGDEFMICCGRRAKPIDLSARKRKMSLKTETVAAPKKKVMQAEEMATRIRSQNRAAAKKYR